MLLSRKLKAFGDMKNSLPKPEEQNEFSRGVHGEHGEVKNLFRCKTKIFFLLLSLRALREESVSAVCLMHVQNQNGNEKFMGQQ